MHLLQCLGEDPSREGLVKTPLRMSKALLALTSGIFNAVCYLATPMYIANIMHALLKATSKMRSQLRATLSLIVRRLKWL
jgi:hypothetical protein